MQQTNNNNNHFIINHDHGLLTFEGHTKTIYYNKNNNLPIFFTASKIPNENSSTDLLLSTSALLASEDHSTSDNLTTSQRKLLHRHCQLGHLHMARVQALAKEGLFGSSNKDIANCEPPLCRACVHGKQHRRPINLALAGSLDSSHLQPGDCISCDQLESTSPGLIATFKGSPSTSSYHAGTLFVDHASRYLFFKPHLSTGALEAIHAKQSFELHASSFNRVIRKYHSDNGIFSSKLFREACLSQHQHLTFCGVDAHHQNGIAERYIRTITEKARTMLIHAMINWPEIITENLLPFAVQLAIDLHNATPNAAGFTPEEIFSGTKHPSNLTSFHSFGCPIFVLEPSLRQGNKIPRWKPRSRVGVYLGMSSEHASSLPLVLSTTTGLVSLQFHVVFDDNFSTTKSLHTNTIPSNWSTLLNNSSISFVDEDFSNTNLYDSTWKDDTPSTTSDSSPLQREPSTPQRTNPSSFSVTSPSSQRETPTRTNPSLSSSSQREISSHSSTTSSSDTFQQRTHSGWNQAHPYNTRFKRHFTANIADSSSSLHNKVFSESTINAFLATQDLSPTIDLQTYHALQNVVSTTASLPKDTLHYGEMQRAPDREHFETDMCREMTELFASDTLELISRSSIPSDNKPLQAIWSFRRKRRPDWTISKYRFRVCPHGGQQIEGINYWDTYAPVISWRTVRLTLVLSLLSGLKSRQVDYVSAYTQAPLDCELFLNIPPGFTVINNKLVFTTSSTQGINKDWALKINKNMYGLKQAGNNWFHHLTQFLLDRGFSQSTIDPCLFIRNNCLVIVYVDDCLLFAPTDNILQQLIDSLQQEFNLTSEGDVGAFLGIDITRNADNFLELTQPGLIQKIISTCGLESESNEHQTPAATILHSDPSGPPREHSWNYRAVIGILTYLSTSTRPDIAFAVHQCARFSIAPKRIHEVAVRRIVRYLKGTKTKGYILRPSPTHCSLDCYVDADFAGLWTPETSHSPMSVKSRTGYIITFASCPILWSSKLQTEVALSTTEAEYIALSQSTRDLIPMRDLLLELSRFTKLVVGDTITHSTIFKDNRGCVELANAPKLHPRTKHIGLKYHHFRSHVARGDIKIQWIDTKHQLADIFTKPLPVSSFEYLRHLLLGW
jgi:hypothetical protein